MADKQLKEQRSRWNGREEAKMAEKLPQWQINICHG